MANLFGRSYNDVGSTDADLILKTRGLIKILWGKKFIDLIKNGKINADIGDIVNSVRTQDNIGTDTGIYYVLEDQSLWVVVGGLKINLKGEIGTTYVSFLGPQETTGDLKYTALTNIGFIYPTLNEAQLASLPNGIVYVEETLKLYTVLNGLLSEYLFEFPNPFPELFVISKVDSTDDGALVIEGSGLSNAIILEGTLIYYNNGTIINNLLNGLHLLNNGKDIIIILNDVTINKKTTFLEYLECNNILSIGANGDTGFRLYMKEGESYLEVDNIITRNSEDEYILPNYYSSKNNIISKVISEDTEDIDEDNDGLIKLKLVHENEYLVGDLLYIYVPTEIMGTEEDEEVETETGIVELLKVLLTVEESDTESNVITVSYDVNKIESIKESLLPGQTLFLLNRPGESNKLIRYSLGNIDLLECTSLEEEEDLHSISTRIGDLDELKQNDILKIEIELDGHSEEYSPELGDIVQGIFSKQLITDDSLLFNANLFAPIFRGGNGKNNYPRYEEGFEIPKEDETKTVVTSEWVKMWCRIICPPGTIMMWSGNSVPEGWALCNGSNGTPNLVDKFIKAGSSAGATGGNPNNEVTLTVDNMPTHSHDLLGTAYTDTDGGHYHYTDANDGSSTSVSQGEGDSATVAAAGSTNILSDYDGSHSHSVDLSSGYTSSEGNSEPFSIEPEYYTLMFIMKLDY